MRGSVVHFIFSLAFVYSSTLLGQNYQTIHIGRQQGLSNTFVTCLYQDSRGIVWIGTLLGLNRYDGAEIKSYVSNQRKPFALKGNYIYSISEDKDGLLWLATEEGVAVFDPFSERAIHLHNFKGELSAAPSSRILFDKNGHAWFNQTKESVPVLYRISAIKGLAKRIREDELTPELFEVKTFLFPEGLGNRVRYMRQIDEELLLMAGNTGLFLSFIQAR
ncbi:MAG: hypothetical protein LW630_10395 [Saprospiraceae bacterium]|nr:hypothetical protein [Saprospiraceae bacterium]